MDKELASITKKIHHIEEALSSIQLVVGKIESVVEVVEELKKELASIEAQLENGDFITIQRTKRSGRRAKWGIRWSEFVLELLATRGLMYTSEIIDSLVSSGRIPDLDASALSNVELRRLKSSIRVALNALSSEGKIKKVSEDYNAPWELKR